MVVLDGRVYQVAGTGVVREVTEPVATPFACVTYWTPASHDDLAAPCSYDEFLDWLLTLLPSPNIFYALRVEGTFDEVHTRSVPAQENYRPLVEVAAHQPEFTFVQTEGTLAGFYTPAFMESINVSGPAPALPLKRPHAGRAPALLPAVAGARERAVHLHAGAGSADEPRLPDVGLPARHGGRPGQGRALA